MNSWMLLLLGVFAALLPMHQCVSTSEPTFTDIRNQCVGTQCAKGQWTTPIAVGDSTNPGVWTTIYAGNTTNPLGTCPSPVYGSCFNSSAGSPGMPIEVMSTGQLRVTYKFKNLTSLVLYNKTSMVPQTMEFKLCYSNVAFNDRPWRKKNKPFPRLSQNCPFDVATVPWPASVTNIKSLTAADQKALSGTVVYDFDDDNMPAATLFVMMWLVCDDGNVCAFESTESPSYSVPDYSIPSKSILVYPPNYGPEYPAPYNVPGPYNGVYIQVNGYNPITSGMTAAAIILSIFGPAFFIAYFVTDHMVYTRTGKALAW